MKKKDDEKRKNNAIIIDNIVKRVVEIKKPVSDFYWIQRREMRKMTSMSCFSNVEYMPTPFEIAKYHGIGFTFEKIEGDMPSYLSYDPDTIHISDMYIEDNYEARILCAHELGHYFLHKGQMCAMNNDSLNLYLPEESMKEYEANVFASIHCCWKHM